MKSNIKQEFHEDDGDRAFGNALSLIVELQKSLRAMQEEKREKELIPMSNKKNCLIPTADVDCIDMEVKENMIDVVDQLHCETVTAESFLSVVPAVQYPV